MNNHWLPIISKKIAGKTDGVVHTNMQDFFHIKESVNQPMIDFGILSFGNSYDEYYLNNKLTEKPQDEIGLRLNEKLIKAR
jgi:hypothetical protein